jgi:hypothetical protein
MHAKLSHDIDLDFLMNENSLRNRFKRLIIHDRKDPVLSVAEILLKEDVKLFIRTVQRVN